MKDMRAFSPYKRAIISGHFTRRTAAFIGYSTYAADVVPVVPVVLGSAEIPECE